jgi:hypothetical protein
MKRVKLVRRMIGSKEPALQVKCRLNDEGHVWISYFDDLPRTVRQRLRETPFNLCPACLVTEYVPEVIRRHPQCSHLKALFAAIEVMELEEREEQSKQGRNDTMMTTFSKGRSER